MRTFDRKTRTIVLSVRDRERAEVDAYKAQPDQSAEAPKISKSLGGLLRDKLIGRKNPAPEDGA